MHHHGAGLRKLITDRSLIRQLSGSDPLSARLDPQDRELLRFALQLTEQPASVEKSDIEELRRVGLDDRAIHDACQVVAYFNFINRIAEGRTENVGARGAESTLTAIMAQMAVDEKREVTWDEVIRG